MTPVVIVNVHNSRKLLIVIKNTLQQKNERIEFIDISLSDTLFVAKKSSDVS